MLLKLFNTPIQTATDTKLNEKNLNYLHYPFRIIEKPRHYKFNLFLITKPTKFNYGIGLWQFRAFNFI